MKTSLPPVSSLQFRGTLAFNIQNQQVPDNAETKGHCQIGSYHINQPEAIAAQRKFNSTYLSGVQKELKKCADALPDDYTLTYSFNNNDQLELSLPDPLIGAPLIASMLGKSTRLAKLGSSSTRTIEHKPDTWVFQFDESRHAPELEKFRQWLPSAINELLSDLTKQLTEIKKAANVRIEELTHSGEAVQAKLNS